MRAITLAVSLAVQLIKLKYLLTGAGSHGRHLWFGLVDQCSVPASDLK
jgi:hypothetical protein